MATITRSSLRLSIRARRGCNASCMGRTRVSRLLTMLPKLLLGPTTRADVRGGIKARMDVSKGPVDARGSIDGAAIWLDQASVSRDGVALPKPRGNEPTERGPRSG